MNEEEIVAEAYKRARRIAHRRGLKKGEPVVHASDTGMIYALQKVRAGIATIGLTAKQNRTGKAIRKKFPLRELFNPNDALNRALAIKAKLLEKDLPTGLRVAVIIIG